MIWLFGLTVLAFYFAVFYRSQSLSEKVYESGKTPAVLLILFKIVVRIVSRRQGRIYHAKPNDRNGKTPDGDGQELTDGATDEQHISASDDEIVIINNYRSWLQINISLQIFFPRTTIARNHLRFITR